MSNIPTALEALNSKNLSYDLELSNRASQIIELKAKQQANMFESVPFKNIPDEMKKMMDSSDFLRVRKNATKIASKEGNSAIAFIPYEGGYLITAMKVVSFQLIGKNEQHVTGVSNAIIEYDGEEYLLHTKIFYKNGVPTISRFIKVTDDKNGTYIVTQGEDISYPSKTLPVEIMFANEDRISDVEMYGVGIDLQKLTYLDSKYTAEWNRVRSMPIINTDISDIDASSFVDKLDKGTKNYIEDDSFNAKYGAGVAILPATNGIVVLQQAIIFLDDRIKKTFGLPTDLEASGNNKQSLEMIIRDPHMTDTIRADLVLKEKHWQNFFNKFAELLNIEAPTIKLEIGFTESVKEKWFNASLNAENAKSKKVQSTNNKGGVENE